MIPLINCPSCQVPIKITFRNNYVYPCSNNNCKINFAERVQFTEEDEIDFQFENGLLLYYSFQIEIYHLKIVPNMKSGPKIYIYSTHTDDEKPIIINQLFELEWINSPTLSEKIKMWVTFS